MSYYRVPFNLDLMKESIQTDGNILFKHSECEFSLRCSAVNEELLLCLFIGQFSAPVQLDSSDKTGCDTVTIMLNLGNAVYYQIDSLKAPRIFPSNAIALCYSDTRAGLCRYQPQFAKLFSLQVPRQVLLEYLNIMQIGLLTQKKLQQQAPFLIIKSANTQFNHIVEKLSEPTMSANTSLHRHLTYSFISDATRYLLQEEVSPKPSYYGENLESAIDILDKEFVLPPTITQLARRIGTNETSLKQWFRKEFNTTVHQYIIQQKMSKAAKLLALKEHSISHIALEVGYSNHGHFAATFKKEFGCSPSSYPSTNKNNAQRIDLNG
ncbi:helix-turn-helix transcriptional regulator [Psychromonas sp. Urea-02u-13]|uniref:helix-turn-helix transcriptional regulator n=1 Tax=Psychromonas sp. Urea-02u-13 TaxID=2058326 RepID=UPI000C34D5CE|nr:response regulator transcription factor [Psychromonas sp. Urea-02u-13]PKG39101.1 AraC family transcriptional regulator [Psychromonas sp. Urea-02u-13]